MNGGGEDFDVEAKRPKLEQQEHEQVFQQKKWFIETAAVYVICFVWLMDCILVNMPQTHELLLNIQFSW